RPEENLLIVGNGTSDSDRSNAFVIAKNGNAWFSRGVRIGNSTSTIAGTLRFNGTHFQGYNGSTWVNLSVPAGGLNWTLNGNTATNPAVDFIGTTDAVNLNFRTNNQNRLTIQSNGNITTNQRVGINVVPSVAALEVYSDTANRSFLVTGEFIGTPAYQPNLGPGTRMFFNVGRAAFRAGYVTSDEFDSPNVGLGSTAFGLNCIARTSHSFVAGQENKAIGSAIGAVVLGQGNTASGLNSTAVGLLNNVSSTLGTAIGVTNTVSGQSGFAIGTENQVLQPHGIAIGFHNAIGGPYSHAYGRDIYLYADNCIGIGQIINVVSGANNSIGIGNVISFGTGALNAMAFGRTIVINSAT
ncbi:MAG: hypothetical protein NZ108_11105, partial [Bacteroidia bacterium]|nr:hypothetical protein [Bacteroidia bacterium]